MNRVFAKERQRRQRECREGQVEAEARERGACVLWTHPLLVAVGVSTLAFDAPTSALRVRAQAGSQTSVGLGIAKAGDRQAGTTSRYRDTGNEC